LSRRVTADFTAGSPVAAFCCKVLHFVASSRGDSGTWRTAESAVALSSVTVEVRASAVFCCIVLHFVASSRRHCSACCWSKLLLAENKVLHAEQPRGIIARPDDRHHQMLVRPQEAASLARLFH